MKRAQVSPGSFLKLKPKNDYLNRLSKIEGCWFAIDSVCVANCWLICRDCSFADSFAKSASTMAPNPEVVASLTADRYVTWLLISVLELP